MKKDTLFNIGLGICLGMVPLIAYNYGAKKYERMWQFFRLARIAILVFACLCAALFFVFANNLIGLFIADAETIRKGAVFLRGRCFSLPFMMIGYHIVNYMNAAGKGKISFLLAILCHIVLVIPIMLLMNYIWGLTGLTWSQLVADFINAVIVWLIFRHVSRNYIHR